MSINHVDWFTPVVSAFSWSQFKLPKPTSERPKPSQLHWVGYVFPWISPMSQIFPWRFIYVEHCWDDIYSLHSKLRGESDDIPLLYQATDKLRPIILNQKFAFSLKVSTIFISFHGLFFSGTVHPTEHRPQLGGSSTQMLPPGQWRGGTSVDGIPFWPVTIHNRNLLNYASPDVFQAFLASVIFYFPHSFQGTGVLWNRLWGRLPEGLWVNLWIHRDLLGSYHVFICFFSSPVILAHYHGDTFRGI